MLKLIGKELYADGKLYADVWGWRSKKGGPSASRGYTLRFADGTEDKNYAYFRDAVRAARDYHRSGIWTMERSAS